MIPVLGGLCLVIAVHAGFIYGVLQFKTAQIKWAIYLKIAATLFLTLYALLSSGPLLLVGALAFSTIGDAFLALDKDKWLLPGMGAFFVAHVLFIAAFYHIGLQPLNPHQMVFASALVVCAIAFIAYLWRSLEAFKLPVLAYAAVIVTMGTCAMVLPYGYLPAVFGAFFFIASDIILSLELFKPHAISRWRWLTGPVLWALYFGGQIMITEGVIYGLRG